MMSLVGKGMHDMKKSQGPDDQLDLGGKRAR